MERFGPKQRRRRPVDHDQSKEWQKFFEGDESVPVPKEQEILDSPLTVLPLSTRIINSLEDNELLYVRDLACRTRDQLLSIKNFGEQTLMECQKALNTLQVKHPDWNKPKPNVKHGQS